MLYACAMVGYIYSFVQFVKMCAFLFTDSVAIRVLRQVLPRQRPKNGPPEKILQGIR